MKLLIYGFESFGKDSTNISQDVVDRLPNQRGIVKAILPVRFNDSIIFDIVKKTNPDHILGLGQYPSGNKIRIERLAKNEWASKSKLSRNIVKGGSQLATATLDLEPNDDSCISHDAGRYFCNYSMYILLTNPKTQDIPFAFLHIPRKFDLDLAVRFVESKIQEILA